MPSVGHFSVDTRLPVLLGETYRSTAVALRADSVQWRSYPHELKYLAHSLGWKRPASLPIRSQRPETVRSAALRSMALRRAEGFSLGVWFGRWGGGEKKGGH